MRQAEREDRRLEPKEAGMPRASSEDERTMEANREHGGPQSQGPTASKGASLSETTASFGSGKGAKIRCRGALKRTTKRDVVGKGLREAQARVKHVSEAGPGDEKLWGANVGGALKSKGDMKPRKGCLKVRKLHTQASETPEVLWNVSGACVGRGWRNSIQVEHGECPPHSLRQPLTRTLGHLMQRA